MNAAAFLLTLERRAPAAEPARDPLAGAHGFLTRHGETAEGQALRRVLRTLATGEGVFAESDAWLFSQETAALVAALIDARLSGRYPESEWRSGRTA